MSDLPPTAADFADLTPNERLAGRLALKGLGMLGGPGRDRSRARVSVALAWICSMSEDKLDDALLIFGPRSGDAEANRDVVERAVAEL